jgi:hypothetical protein
VLLKKVLVGILLGNVAVRQWLLVCFGYTVGKIHESTSQAAMSYRGVLRSHHQSVVYHMLEDVHSRRLKSFLDERECQLRLQRTAFDPQEVIRVYEKYLREVVPPVVYDEGSKVLDSTF